MRDPSYPLAKAQQQAQKTETERVSALLNLLVNVAYYRA
jgi:hypothetical protein